MGKMKEWARRGWGWLRGVNPFVLVGLLLALWMLWPAEYNIWGHLRLKREIAERVQEKRELEQKIRRAELGLKELETEPDLLEKYAREEFLMKEEDEELYLLGE